MTSWLPNLVGRRIKEGFETLRPQCHIESVACLTQAEQYFSSEKYWEPKVFHQLQFSFQPFPPNKKNNSETMVSSLDPYSKVIALTQGLINKTLKDLKAAYPNLPPFKHDDELAKIRLDIGAPEISIKNEKKISSHNPVRLLNRKTSCN